MHNCTHQMLLDKAKELDEVTIPNLKQILAVKKAEFEEAQSKLQEAEMTRRHIAEDLSRPIA